MPDTSDPYCWPGTECLQNKLEIRDSAKLRDLEAKLVAIREVQIAVASLPGAYDLSHLREFHRRLFSDVYEWAGETRTVNIHRGTDWFALHEFVDDQVSAGLAKLERTRFLTGRKPAQFIEEFAYFYGELNALHPFREGNGRTQRAFWRQLAAAAGYHLDWSELNRTANTEACAHNLRTADTSRLVVALRPVVLQA